MNRNLWAGLDLFKFSSYPKQASGIFFTETVLPFQPLTSTVDSVILFVL